MKLSRVAVTIPILWIGLLFSNPVYSAVITWNGLGADNNWNTSGNWNTGLVPAPADTALFDGTSNKDCLINIPVHVQNFIVQGPSTGTVSIQGNQVIQVSQEFNLSGGVFNAGSAIFNIHRNWVVTSSNIFNAQTSTVSFTSINISTITGPTHFNVFKSTEVGKNIYFDNLSTITISGYLELNQVFLHSKVPGSSWALDKKTSNMSVSTISVQDGNASMGFPIQAGAFSTDEGNNINWIFTSTRTPLNPYFSFISSSSLKINWTNISTHTYIGQFSNDQNFIGAPSLNLSTNTTQFFNLTPSTSYWFRVRVSTEPNFHFNNKIGTSTFSGGFANLNPYFSLVNDHQLDVNWDNYGSNYLAELSSVSNFSNSLFSSTMTANLTHYYGLNAKTTYFFRVKLSTDTGFHSNNIISTTTLDASSFTFLAPYFTFVGSNSLSASWIDVTTGSYLTHLSTSSNFGIINYSSQTILSTVTFVGLMTNTSYYFRVRVATEAAFNPGNIISTHTLNTATQTNLNPFFVWVGSTSLQTQWSTTGGNSVDVEISTSPNYLPPLHSGPMLGTTTNYFNLSPDTSYFFRVKFSTESGFHGNNMISTTTLKFSTSTYLAPYFTFVGSNSLSASWIDVTTGSYLTHLSTSSNFGIINYSSQTILSTVTFVGLMTNTSYYFRVQVTTEPAFIPSNVISTHTLNAVTQTNLNPFFVWVGSTSLQTQWDTTIGNVNVEISTSPTHLPPLYAGNMFGTTTSYFSLLPSTSYFFRVKLSTEIGFNVNNNISTTTLKGNGGQTNLNPFFVLVGSTSLQSVWDTTNGSVDAEISTSPTYSPLLYSGNLNGYTTTYFNLLPSSSYFFRVKISTEAGFQTNNKISTVTLASAGYTNLNPFIAGVGIDFVHIYWDYISGKNYIPVLALDGGFSTIISSGMVGTSDRNFISLSSATTYYFKVKLSDEPNAAYSVAIQTTTYGGGAGGNMALDFFSGQNQFTNVPSVGAYDFTGIGTFEFWFKRTNLTAQVQHLIAKDNPAGTNGWTIRLQADNRIRYTPLGVGGGITSTVVINDMDWHHLALTKSGSNVATMYIDGANVASGATNSPNTNTDPLLFGRAQIGTQGFNGQMDEVRIWNTERTGAEINANKLKPLIGNEPGLVSYWNFDESDPEQYIYDLHSPFENGWRGSSTTAEPNDPIRVFSPIPGFGSGGDTTRPNIYIQNPLNASTRTIAQLSILSGTAQDNFDVKWVKYEIKRLSDNYFWAFNNLGSNGPGNWGPSYTLNTATGTFDWIINGFDVIWATGSYRLITTAEDKDFNVRSATSVFTVVTSTDPVPPTIFIQYPIQGSTYTPTQLTYLSGTANDNVSLNLVGVTLIRNSDSKSWDGPTQTWVASTNTVNIANGLQNWNLYLPFAAWTLDGLYTLLGTAMDEAGNLASSNRTFNVQVSTGGIDSVPPTAKVIHPANGSVHAPEALQSVNGTAADNVSVTLTKINILNKNTTRYFDGSSFNSVPPVWFQMSNLTSWVHSGISSNVWTNGQVYALTATAKDAAGNSGVDISTFSINTSAGGDTINPTVYISSPINGGTYDPTSLAFRGNAADNVGLKDIKYKLKRNSDNLYYDGVDFTAATGQEHLASGRIIWNFGIPPAAFDNGGYTLTVIAIDTSDNQGTQTVSFTIAGAINGGDTVPPVIKILYPVNGTNYTDPASLTLLTGTAEDNISLNEVVFSLKDDNNKYWDGNKWDLDNEFWLPATFFITTWTAHMPFAAWKNGIFDMRARARDDDNNITYDALTFTTSGMSGTGAADSQPPQSFVNNPPPGANQPPSAFAFLNGRSDDSYGIDELGASLYQVQSGVYWDGSGFNTTTEIFLTPTITKDDPYFKEWEFQIPPAAYSDGNYIFTIYAKDPSGNQSNVPVTFTVSGSGGGDTTPPTLSIISHNDGYSYSADQVLTLSGTASDNSNMGFVDIKIRRNADGKYFDGVDWTTSESWAGTSGLNNWTYKTPHGIWVNGGYNITARAWDTSFNQFTETIGLTIAGLGSPGTPPTASILFPLNGNSYTPANIPTFSGSATDDSAVNIVEARITDLNSAHDWDPTLRSWVFKEHWFTTTISGGNWNSLDLPIWTNSQFRLAVRSTDDSSLLSTPQSITFFVNNGGSDNTAPAKINTLTAKTGTTAGSVKLTWQATGDDGNTGTATKFSIKYHSEPINYEQDWVNAQNISLPPVSQTAPTPGAPGTLHTLTINKLNPGAPYFWAIRAYDEDGNRSLISNSQFAAAKEECAAGTGDGEGAATVSPSSLAEQQVANATIVVTVGASGITTGGKVILRVPNNWALPTQTATNLGGYITHVISNQSATASLSVQGPNAIITIDSGSLNQGDTVTFIYSANPSCGIQAGIPLDILTQANSCGIPKPISSQPTVNITAGPITWLGFDNFDQLVKINDIETFKVQGQNDCGSIASLGSNTNVTVSAVSWNAGTNTWDLDPNAQLSVNSDLSSPFASNVITINSGDSDFDLYYKLTSAANSGNNMVRIQYTDFISAAASENILNMIPYSGTGGFTGLTIDNGTQGSNTTAALKPSDSTLSRVFINFALGNPDLSWKVAVSNDNFSTIQWETYGTGSPSRLVWDGRLLNGYEIAPPGTYRIRLSAGGLTEDTTLTLTLTAPRVSGTIQDNSNSNKIESAFIDLFGTNAAPRHTQSDSNGDFGIGGLPDGTYQLQINKPGYSPYSGSIIVSGGSANLGTINLKPEAALILAVTRTETSPELWGMVKAKASGEEHQFYFRMPDGEQSADDGIGNTAQFPMLTGNSIDLTLTIPGYNSTTLTRTFTEGEQYTWTAPLTSKPKISGQIYISNSVAAQSNDTPIFMKVGLDANSDGVYDLGYPSFFTDAVILAFERSANYSFPGMAAGTYLVEVSAEGFAPQTGNVTLATVDITKNFTVTKDGQMVINFTFTGDSTVIPESQTGYFGVPLRIQSATGVSITKFIEVPANATLTTHSETISGVPDGLYSLFIEKLFSFKPNFTGNPTVTVAGGTGSSNLTFTQNSGSLVGNITFPSGSAIGDLEFKLTKKDGTIRSNPTTTSTQFTFSKLGSGVFTVSVFDTRTKASINQTVNITDAEQTTVDVNLAAVNTFTLSGTFRTIAAPPYHTLASIDSNSTPASVFTANGTKSVASMRVEAYLLNVENPVFSLPTTNAQPILDESRILIADVNPVNGQYTLPGLKQDKSYRVNFVVDLNGDGKSNFPIGGNTYSLTENLAGADFTIKDGASITGTLTAPASDDGHSLTIQLRDVKLQSAIDKPVVLSGTSASFSFTNLRTGQYLIQILDSETPAKYKAKPVFINLESETGSKAVSMTLLRSAYVRGKLASTTGELITLANSTYLLPTGFQIQLISDIHRTAASLSADGTFTAEIIPNTNYLVDISPPLDNSEVASGKGFLSVQFKVNVGNGQYSDWGVIALQAGTDVEGSVFGTTAEGASKSLAGIPVLVVESLSKSIDPIRFKTDENGRFDIQDLNPTIRFYDFKINPTGDAESNSTFSEFTKKMVDITKAADIQNLSFTLTEVQGKILGDVDPAAGKTLIASYGENQGVPGVNVLVRNKTNNKLLDFISKPDGTFSIPLPEGLYDFEFMAKGHKTRILKNQLVTKSVKTLESITLLTGVKLSGTLKNADGSLPTEENISQLFAFDASNNPIRGFLEKESITKSISGYAFNGLSEGLYSIGALDKIGQLKIVTENILVPNQDSILDLTFSVAEPKLTASFIQKLPNGVEIKFASNQNFYEDAADLNANGTPDTDEFINFVSLVQGNGTLTFDAVSPTRRGADYTYTRGNETGQLLEVKADFTTEEINPATGANYTVTGNFKHHFGLVSQQADNIYPLGGELLLPGGAALIIPNGAIKDGNLDGTQIGLSAADALGTFTGESAAVANHAASSGGGAMALAEALGPAAYPAHMYRAIKTLASAPSVSPFSSFYDIFLPATVSRVFTNAPTLTLKYDDNADPTTLNIYYFNEAQGIYTIENTDRRIDTANKTISVAIGHASIFTVLASSAAIIQGDAYAGELTVFNFPNPFNLESKTVTLQNPGSSSASQTIPGTMIKIGVPVGISGALKIDIYTVAGQKVTELTDYITAGGTHQYIQWDGKNQSGKQVASGVYIGRLTIENGNEKFFKMAVIK